MIINNYYSQLIKSYMLTIWEKILRQIFFQNINIKYTAHVYQHWYMSKSIFLVINLNYAKK